MRFFLIPCFFVILYIIYFTIKKTVTKLANDMATKGLIQFKNSLVIKNGIAMDHERVYGVVQV